MSDEPFFSPRRTPRRPRQPQPGEHLWTVTKKGHTCHAELRPGPGELCELQLFADGEFRWGQLLASRDWALTAAGLKLEALRVKGWREVAEPATDPHRAEKGPR